MTQTCLQDDEDRAYAPGLELQLAFYHSESAPNAWCSPFVSAVYAAVVRV
jgi:hypothetical protein